MEENKGDVMTFLVISAAIEWLEQHHERVKTQEEERVKAKKDKEDALLQVNRNFFIIRKLNVYNHNINQRCFITFKINKFQPEENLKS